MACAYLKKFLAFLQHLECFCSRHFATFRNFFLENSIIQNPWQHSESGFEEEKHYVSEGFHFEFPCNLCCLLLNFCILKSCWKILFKVVSEEKFWVFLLKLSGFTAEFFWKIRHSHSLLLRKLIFTPNLQDSAIHLKSLQVLC